MSDTKTGRIVLAVLQFLGLVISSYGFWIQYTNLPTTSGIIYCGSWYLFGALANIFGLISFTMTMLSGENDALDYETPESLMQYSVLFSWLNIVVGYPLMVGVTWRMFDPKGYLPYIIWALIIIPILAFIGRFKFGMVITTQVCSIFALLAHGVICYMLQEYWGIAAAAVMALNIVSMSLPTRYHVWVFSSRETLIIGVVLTGYLMHKSIFSLIDKRK